MSRTGADQRKRARDTLEGGERLKVRVSLLLLADLEDAETERDRLDRLATDNFKRWMHYQSACEELQAQMKDQEEPE